MAEEGPQAPGAGMDGRRWGTGRPRKGYGIGMVGSLLSHVLALWGDKACPSRCWEGTAVCVAAGKLG